MRWLDKKTTRAIIFTALVSAAMVSFLFLNKPAGPEVLPGPEPLLVLQNLSRLLAGSLVSYQNSQWEDFTARLTDVNGFWQSVTPSFRSAAPAPSAITNKWPDKMSRLDSWLAEADRQAQEKNYARAADQINQALSLAAEILADKRQADPSAAWLDFYRAYQPIIALSSKNDIAPYWEEIKFRFTALKQFPLGAQYERTLADLEAAIGQMDKSLDGPDFLAAKEKINIIFLGFFDRD